MADLINGFKHHTINKNGVVINTKTGNIKAIWKGANGYYHVDIQEFNKPKKVALHRLLALQYIPNPEGKRTVNHIDGNKLNNSLSNLEWATDSENIQHAYDTRLNSSRAIHDDTFFEPFLLNHFLKGESITNISKDPTVKNTLTQTSIHLRDAAARLDKLKEFEEELLSQKNKRAKLAGERKRIKIQLYMIDKVTGQILRTFSSMPEAKEYLGKKSSGPISNAVAGRTKSAYGYFWVKG